MIGTGHSVLIRLELTCPGPLLIDYDVYNMVVTSHALTMIFFLVIPVIIGGFGNWLVPLMLVGADMAFPRINNLSFWLVPAAMSLLLFSSLIGRGFGGGWTFYPPLSRNMAHSGPATEYAILALHVGGVSSILAAINFITTFVAIRPETFSLLRTQMFVWGIGVTRFLLIVAMPVLAGALTMLLTDRNFNTRFFDPVGLGDPMLFAHLFWFFGHPEVYILILPGFGIISHVLKRAVSKLKVFGKLPIIYAIKVIGLLGFLV